MSNEMLRWGLICTARINQSLIPTIRAEERSALVGVSSRDGARARRYAENEGIPQAYEGYEALLAAPDIDVIYNALPNHLHAEWTIRAADAGKHVLCEKPLALTVDEVEAIAAAAERNGVTVFEGFMYRHHPQTLKVQELVRQGAIGEVRAINAVFSFVLDRAGDVRFDPTMGGGSLWDVGCYPVSFIRSVMGAEPDEVFGWQTLSDGGVDLTFAGSMCFDEGTLAQFDCSFETAFRWGAEVAGSEGVITLESPWKPGAEKPPVIQLEEGEGRQEVPVEDIDPYLCEVRQMADCVLEGADPLISLADSRNNVATINALYHSARTGEPVSIV